MTSVPAKPLISLPLLDAMLVVGKRYLVVGKR